MYEPVQMKTFTNPSLEKIADQFNAWVTPAVVIVETQTHYSAALQKFFSVVLYSLDLNDPLKAIEHEKALEEQTQEREEDDVSS